MGYCRAESCRIAESAPAAARTRCTSAEAGARIQCTSTPTDLLGNPGEPVDQASGTPQVASFNRIPTRGDLWDQEEHVWAIIGPTDVHEFQVRWAVLEKSVESSA